MRTFFTLAFIGLLNVTASVYSQNTRLDIEVKETAIRDVFKLIETQSDFKFFYNENFIDLNKKVTCNTRSAQVEEILNEIFAQSGISYKVLENNLIVIAPAVELKQGNTVTGTVTGSAGEPLPGVNVVIKGTTTGVVTDIDGKFSISVPGRETVLAFSFIGYAGREIAVGDQTSVNISLAEDTKEIEEVVVVGYGITRKATVTGSVSTMKGEKLSAIPSGNFSNALAGKFAGLTSITTSGQPGNDNSTLRIRGTNTLGNNSPLVVVDGVPGRDINRLNPNDIDNITILKDASAAIYGAQAANGVILVTTKRGVTGKSTASVNVRQGWSQPTIIPEYADAANYAQALNEIDQYANRTPRYTADDLRLFADGTDPWGHPNSDWYDIIFRKTTPQTNVDASLSGGSENVKYYASAAYTYQDGIFRNSATRYDQIGIRSNVDAKVTEHINLGLDLAFRQENRHNSTVAMFELLRYGMGRPNRVAYYGDYPASGYESGRNPAVTATDAAGYDKRINYVLQSNVKLDVTIPWVEGLAVTGYFAYDKSIQNQKIWRTPWMLYTWDGKSLDADNMPIVAGALSGYSNANLDQNMNDGYGLMMNALVNYARTFNDAHNVKAMLGIERNAGESMNFSAYRTYFASMLIDELFAGGDLDKTNTGSSSHSGRLNYFGRFNYDYRYKYLLEFVFRYDGSYIFPQGKQFGFFPSVSAGWVISEEDFWKSGLPFINTFKIRGSWGQTGNDRVDAYQYLASFGFDNSADGSMGAPKDSRNTTVFNGTTEAKFLKELRIPNVAITWEVATQSNIGFDMTTMNNKLRVSADYFNNLRSNILCYRNASIPSTAGLTLPRENIGKVSNRGVEFDVTYADKIGEFSYAINVNGGYAKSKIKFWDESPNVPDWQRATGKAIRPALIGNNSAGLFYEAIGIFRDEQAIEKYPHWQNAKPGDIIFRDVNDDKKIDGLDRVRSDKTDIPIFTGGLNIDLSWKGIYLALGFQGATGATRYHEVESGELGNFSMEDLNGRWTSTNIDALKPRVGNYRAEYWNQTVTNPNTYWNRKTDYLRLKNMELGYDLPSSVYSKIGLQSLRVYFSGMNLLTFTSLETFDPETTSNTAYPLNKVYSIGLSLTF